MSDADAFPDPYQFLPQVPSFQVTSADFADGAVLPPPLRSKALGVEGGEDRSPQVSWSGFPEGTQSFAVTLYDPCAPTASGYWHWAVADIPTSVTSLPSGAGSEGGSLPPGAVQLRNDNSTVGYVGAAPPPGHGDHRYYLVVHAVDVPSLGLPADTAPATLGFNLFFHTVGRGRVVGRFGH